MLTTTLAAWRDSERRRRAIITENRARRMRSGPKLPPLPVPPRADKPQRVQLTDAAGDYVGTFDVGVSVEGAADIARERGYVGPFTSCLVDAF
jgi:hypothetical protein